MKTIKKHQSFNWCPGAAKDNIDLDSDASKHQIQSNNKPDGPWADGAAGDKMRPTFCPSGYPASSPLRG
ncbi:hypothetical protein [Hydrogenophaga sp.]|uniref:hypothetical protein n=1 Tax=Hydrogenophaga sp. TaxID=1904254 RepID=UPI00271B599A|nr:hypothetical protein [Hydrogenophaga sp.]MDO9437145.1 hypothetical protein [Hydrogenophaga sp.]